MPEQKVEEVIDAQMFRLVDEEGRVRGALTMDDGGVALVFTDQKGTARASIRLTETGAPHITLYDDNGDGRGVFNLIGGEPTIGLTDGEGSLRATIGIHEGEPLVEMYSDDGQVIWKQPT